MGCSDGSIRLVQKSIDECCKCPEIVQKFDPAIQDSDDSAVILHHSFSNETNKILCGTDCGSLALFDVNDGKCLTFGEKVHNYAIWYSSFGEDENIVYSASDDASFKKFDIRMGLEN